MLHSVIKQIAFFLSLDKHVINTRALEQAQIRDCSGSSFGPLFYHKADPAPELLDTTAPVPSVKHLNLSLFVHSLAQPKTVHSLQHKVLIKVKCTNSSSISGNES